MHHIDISHRLNDFMNQKQQTTQDQLAAVAIEQAIKATQAGNYPVGAIVVDSNQQILACNHNQVFSPYYNSMAHAEMTTLNAFEKEFADLDHSGCSLITTLEPCLMCYSRLLISKINRIYYLAEDPRHGAVDFAQQFPPSYDTFKESKQFAKYPCSAELEKIASDLFFLDPSWDGTVFHSHQ